MTVIETTKELEGVKLEKNVEVFLLDIIDDLINDFTENLEVAESPIEQLMLIALNAIGTKNNHYFRKIFEMFDVLDVEPQKEVGKYRLDFLISCLNQRKESFLFAVECDGMEYHLNEKSFQHDRKRDRELLSEGVITIRFSGKEITESPLRCANLVYETIYNFVKGVE